MLKKIRNLEESRMEKMRGKSAGQEGITLIALVITVIIMLILAFVAISALTNREGLFGKTQLAADIYSKAVQNEADKITGLMDGIDGYINGVPPAPVQAASVVSVGDYINYDAGDWSVEDLDKITSSAGSPTLSRTVNDSTTGNQALPTMQGQFGGFEIGGSRNKNSTSYVFNCYGVPRTEGWRVWDIDSSTGVVTLISAGHPETYYHNADSVASINILRNRNCSMYENSYAQIGSAHILTGQEVVSWYNKQYGTDHTIVESYVTDYIHSDSSFYGQKFSTEAPIEVLENGSYYWIASAYSADLVCISPHSLDCFMGYNSVIGFGVRFLVSLKPDVLLEQGTGNGSEENPWRFAGSSTAPTIAIIKCNNINETSFTLTATGEDETGIAKYEFYINNVLENTVNTTEETATYNVTGKTAGTTYTCKVRVYDEVGNYKESIEISVIPEPAVRADLAVSVGDYINYDAGEWITEDLEKITSSVGSPTLNSSVNDSELRNREGSLTQGQFGGFEIGQSRNTNAYGYYARIPIAEGWRVWDIDSLTGVVTLISAGNPELYCNSNGNAVASMNILTNRNCDMYVDSKYATSAHILTAQEAVTWYNKYFEKNYTIVENDGSASTFPFKAFSRNAPIEVLENDSNYWFASAYNSSFLYFLSQSKRYVSYTGNGSFGVRFLISLKPNTLLEQSTGDGSLENPWRFVEN